MPSHSITRIGKITASPPRSIPRETFVVVKNCLIFEPKKYTPRARVQRSRSRVTGINAPIQWFERQPDSDSKQSDIM